MKRMFRIAVNVEECCNCGFCQSFVACSARKVGCIGCGACQYGCPDGVRELKDILEERKEITIRINGDPVAVPERISVLKALELNGFKVSRLPDQGDIFAPCRSGGCGSCAVLINGVLERSCITPVADGMDIVTEKTELQKHPPVRIITPMRPYPHFIPSLFTHGCNYRCGACHNWEITFASAGSLIVPKNVHVYLGFGRVKTNQIGISGGEPTLNRRWLVDSIKDLRARNNRVMIQLDTNASLLSPEYIDELVEVGVTHISPDIKAIRLKTFMDLTGLSDKELAETLLKASWNAVKYIQEVYHGRVFMVVAIPYRPEVTSKEELFELGKALSDIDPYIPVNVVEYQPAFRWRDWRGLQKEDMDEARGVLEEAGIKSVVIQGGAGIPRALDPLDLVLGTEEF